jgi:uncharacterized protein
MVSVLQNTESGGMLPKFLESCHEKGQTRRTPLILRYEEGDYNTLYQDIYGEVSFPFRVLTLQSRRKQDHTDGEFSLVTQRPRAQSIGEDQPAPWKVSAATTGSTSATT